MTFAFAMILKRFLPIDFKWAERLAVIIPILILAAVLLGVIFGVKSCMVNRQNRITTEQVQKLNRQNSEARKAELDKIITEVDETRAERDAKIEKINTIFEQEQRKRNGRDVTAEELERILEATQ